MCVGIETITTLVLRGMLPVAKVRCAHVAVPIHICGICAAHAYAYFPVVLAPYSLYLQHKQQMLCARSGSQLAWAFERYRAEDKLARNCVASLDQCIACLCIALRGCVRCSCIEPQVLQRRQRMLHKALCFLLVSASLPRCDRNFEVVNASWPAIVLRSFEASISEITTRRE